MNIWGSTDCSKRLFALFFFYDFFDNLVFNCALVICQGSRISVVICLENHIRPLLLAGSKAHLSLSLRRVEGFSLFLSRLRMSPLLRIFFIMLSNFYLHRILPKVCIPASFGFRFLFFRWFLRWDELQIIVFTIHWQLVFPDALSRQIWRLELLYLVIVFLSEGGSWVHDVMICAGHCWQGSTWWTA